jgi:hypothetical protein
VLYSARPRQILFSFSVSNKEKTSFIKSTPGRSVVVLDLQHLRRVADLAVDESAEDVHVAADDGAGGLLPSLGHRAVDVPVAGARLVGQAVVANL